MEKQLLKKQRRDLDRLDLLQEEVLEEAERYGQRTQRRRVRRHRFHHGGQDISCKVPQALRSNCS